MANNFLGGILFGDESFTEDYILKYRDKFSTIGDLKIFFRGYISNITDLPFSYKKGFSQSEQFTHCFAEAYRKWSKELIKFVFGEFALAIIDIKTGELFLTHDVLGISPLFYNANSDGVFFSSSLELILEYNNEKKIIDEEYIADFLAYGDHFGNRTPYCSIKRLTAGESLLFSNRNRVSQNNITLSVPNQIRYSDVTDYEDHFKDLVTAAIKTAIPENSKTWCELSGGLDSSTVVCAAAMNRDANNMNSISFVYSKSKTADESIWIQSVTNTSKMPAVWLDVDSFPPFSKIPTNNSSQPYLAMINLALFEEYDTILKKNNVDVVLTGEGGDAVLFGDGPEPFFLADLLRKGNFISLTKQIRYWTQNGSHHRPTRYWLERCAIQPFKNWRRNQLIQDRPHKISWLMDENSLLKERNGNKRRSWVKIKNCVEDSWYLERILRCSNVVSFWEHRASMRAEFRHPLMNIALINFMRSIPWDIKLSPISDRYLQRNALSGILPEIVIKRNTKGSPDPAIYTGFEANNKWENLLTQNPKLVSRGYVNQAKWNQAVQFAKLGQCECIKQFKAAAVLELWLRQLSNEL